MSGSYGIRAVGLVAWTQAEPAAEATRVRGFAVQTKYRFEKKVAAQLQQKSFEVYLPLRSEQHSWSDRQTSVRLVRANSRAPAAPFQPRRQSLSGAFIGGAWGGFKRQRQRDVLRRGGQAPGGDGASRYGVLQDLLHATGGTT